MRFLTLLLLSVLCFGVAQVRAEPPNVVIIFIDDQGYYDLGCYGATEVKTPRIDRLAAEGIRFTDYYAAAPICSPSRAGLLTGAYPRRIGMETWVQRADSNRGIHPDEVTIAELFRNNSYATACVGKWHLGAKAPFVPNAQGFDYHFGMYSNLDPVEIVYYDKDGPPILRNGEIVKKPVDPAELTELYTTEAISWIKSKGEEPFFLYLSHTMLHVPLGVSKKFQGSSNWGEYGDAIQEIDYNVGRLMDSLKALGIADNTIVLYASDNGRGPGRNAKQPHQGRKLTTWECGIRVPAILWGPGAGIMQGEPNSKLISALDWLPTFASAAGIEIPEDHPIIDGRDLWHIVTGDHTPPLNADLPNRRRWEQGLEWSERFTRQDYQDAFFYHGAEGQLSAVRSGSYKMHLSPQLTIYDLEADPGETTPIRDRDITRRLRGMAVMFMEEMSRDARQSGETRIRW
jgi:arylsulfatase A